MQNPTKSKIRRGAVISALVVIGLLAVYLAVVLCGLLEEVVLPWMVVGILLVYALVIIGIMVGVVAALRQRLREIEGGEEEDARKY